MIKVICNKAGTWERCRKCPHSKEHEPIKRRYVDNLDCLREDSCYESALSWICKSVHCIPVTEFPNDPIGHGKSE